MPTPLKVLIAEDVPSDAELVVRELRRAGFAPEWHRVQTEEDFLRLLDPGLDIILSDYQMPQFTGLRALALLKKSGLDIPFIIISGTIGEEVAVAAIKQGATDYLLKDRLARVGAAVSQALGQCQLRRQHVQAEQKLRELDQRLAGVIHSATDAIITVNERQEIVLFNPAAESMFQCEAATALGGPLERFIPEGFREGGSQNMRDTGQIAEARRTMGKVGAVHGVRSDGTEFPIEASISHMEVGGHKLFTVILRDISERRKSGAMRSQYVAIIESSSDAIISKTLDGIITSWNPGAEKLYGYTTHEAVGQPMAALFKAAHANEESKILAQIERGESVQHFETQRQRKDGSLIDVSVTISPLRNSEGQIVGASNISRDITERKQAEEATLRQARLLDSSFDAILVWALGGAIIYWNQGAQDLYGYTSAEACGQVSHVLLKASCSDEDKDYLHELEERGAWTGICSHSTKDGRRLQVESRLQLVREKGGDVLVLESNRDMTERIQLEARLHQSQRLESIGQLAGGVAHDFNNLLTVIMGYSESLLMDLRPEDAAHEPLLQIKLAGERAAGLTRQLLAFSRKQVLAPRKLDLNEVISNVDKMLRRLIGEDVILTNVLSPGLYPALVDPGQIEQVIVNLAVNARDAMPQGGNLTIETRNADLDEEYCKTHPEVQPGPHVMLSISDTGTGIAPEIREHIFEPFFTTKETGKGTGLGLASVFGIIKQSEGTIEVYSEVNVGTSFKIYLPAVLATDAHAETGQTSPTAGRGTETILLIEDEEVVRKIARIALEKYGYKVIEAPNGMEGVLVGEDYAGPIQLLITDVVMPEMGGAQTAEMLSLIRPGMKVLFMSGYIDDAVVRHGIVNAEQAFIHKPFSQAELVLKVREVLDKQG